MSIMFNWASFFTYAIVTAMTPGPNNIMSMSNGSRRGFRGALPFNFGILAGFGAVMVLCTAFCSLLSVWIPRVKAPMLAAGACYMLYLAWETFRGSDTIEEDHSRDGFLSGLLLQFVNPKIYIYCVMSMEAYILPLAPFSSGSFPNTQSSSIRSWRSFLSAARCRCSWHDAAVCGRRRAGGR